MTGRERPHRNEPDPTRNVLDLVEAAIQRQDDMARLRTSMSEQESAHVREVLNLRATHSAEMQAKEAERLDNVRSVDNASIRTATEALNGVLASMQKDIADLRRAQYEALGQKTQVVETRAVSNAIVGWIFGAIGAGIGIISFVIAVTNNP